MSPSKINTRFDVRQEVRAYLVCWDLLVFSISTTDVTTGAFFCACVASALKQHFGGRWFHQLQQHGRWSNLWGGRNTIIFYLGSFCNVLSRILILLNSALLLLLCLAESESYVSTYGQSASLSWNKVPIWDDQIFITVRQLRICWCGALSLKRTGLSFTTAAGPQQRSHSRVRVPWDWRPYFTASDTRLPFSSPPMTRRATWRYSTPPPVGRLTRVESYVTTDGQSASVSWNKAPIWGLGPDFYYCQTVTGLLMWGTLSQEDRSVVYNCSWSSPAQSLSGPRPVGPATIFYCLRLETSILSPPTIRRATVEVFDPAPTRDSFGAVWLSVGLLSSLVRRSRNHHLQE
jgi:hypothetical protein